ncbi:MAG TPA: DUF6474 family protein [Pseudonocardiaceae bacterium]
MARRKQQVSGLDPTRVKRLLAVARIVGPVLVPFLMRAAALAREGYDRMRARQLGIPVDALPAFTGRGAALHVRLAGLASAARELRERQPDAETAAFVQDTEKRLTDLAAAVRAAEHMPAARRRVVHRSVGTELDLVETELLRRLGVR